MANQLSLGERLLKEFDELETQRQVWEDHWQIVGELVHGTKQNFTEKNTPGERLNEDRHDSSAVFANRSLASALVGMLWPNGARSMRLIPARGLTESQENKQYFDQVTETMQEAMDDPLAGLTVALDEYMLDQGAFGTSGIGIFDGGDVSDLSFRSWGIVRLYVDEGLNGRVDKEALLLEWPLRRILRTFGVENVSQKLRDKADNVQSLDEKFELIHFIKPREDRDRDSDGNLDMPFMSVWLEKDGAHVIEESGFSENPVKIARFRKLPYEKYGRSPGMDALSEVLELDYLRERFTVNVDKAGDPPLIVLDDGKFGGGIIDTSAGALNVIDVSGRIPNNIDPIQPLQTVGELNTTLTRIEQLKQDIAQHFFLDKLLDFNNQAEMTASEALLRDRIRAAALGSIFNRQIAEVFNPMISRCFNVMLAKGRLGVIRGSIEEQIALSRGEEPLIIPDEIAEKMIMGDDFFEIRYFTPAARMQRLQEAEALNDVTQYKLALQQANMEAGDLFDDDEALKERAQISGVPANVIRSQEAADAIRAQRQEMQQAAQLAQVAEQAGAAASNFSQAGVI